MSLTRRYSAALFAASALLLGACGGDTAPTNPTDTPEIGDNPRIISISPSSMIFESENGVVPGPQTLATSGLVAIGSAVTFGPVDYNEATSPWLRISSTPIFQREPLAWLHQVSIDAAAFNALPDGSYLRAEVPVIVPAALNSPLTLRVSLCKDLTGCNTIRLGDTKGGELSGPDEWNRGDIYNPNGTGYFYEDWRLFVDPMSTVYVQMNGGGCGTPGGTLHDPVQYVFNTAMNNLITANDDNDCLNSEVVVTNNTGVEAEYLLRATSYSSGDNGTYTIIVSGQPFFNNSLRAEPATEHPLVAAKRKSGK
jgi:hypothetical protein